MAWFSRATSHLGQRGEAAAGGETTTSTVHCVQQEVNDLSNRPTHAGNRNADVIRKTELKPLDHRETSCQVQRFTRQGRDKFEHREPSGPCLAGTLDHELASESPPRHARLNKEGANAGRLRGRIKQRIRTHLGLVTTEQGPPPAPPSTSRELRIALDHEVGCIRNELRIDSEDMPDHGFSLRRRVVRRTQLPRRASNQRLDSSDVACLSTAQTMHD